MFITSHKMAVAVSIRARTAVKINVFVCEFMAHASIYGLDHAGFLPATLD
jgi:hypothetical protein